jgi:hypothetical protein
MCWRVVALICQSCCVLHPSVPLSQRQVKSLKAQLAAGSSSQQEQVLELQQQLQAAQAREADARWAGEAAAAACGG